MRIYYIPGILFTLVLIFWTTYKGDTKFVILQFKKKKKFREKKQSSENKESEPKAPVFSPQWYANLVK